MVVWAWVAVAATATKSKYKILFIIDCLDGKILSGAGYEQVQNLLMIASGDQDCLKAHFHISLQLIFFP